MLFRLEKIVDADIKWRSKGNISLVRLNSKWIEIKIESELIEWFDFHLLSSTKGEAGDEKQRGVGLLAVGQAGAKHQ